MASSFEQRYQKIERTPLGEGTYGEVYKVKNVITGEILAMKRMKLQDEEEGVPSTAIREVAVLKEMNHDNIVKLLDVCCTQNKLLLVFEFVDSDLKKYMRRNGTGPLKSYEAKNFVSQMLKGICFCHERRIIHRDLKPQNLLVTESGLLKLADFGLARTYTVPMPKYTHEVVTVWYRSPEILLGQELYALPVDLWSAGCIFAEMGCGQPLFAGDSEIDTIFKIFQKLGTPSEADWQTMYELPDMKRTFPQWRKKQWRDIRGLGAALGEGGCDLLEQIMKYDPMRRLSAKQALRHEYFQEEGCNNHLNAISGTPNSSNINNASNMVGNSGNMVANNGNMVPSNGNNGNNLVPNSGNIVSNVPNNSINVPMNAGIVNPPNGNMVVNNQNINPNMVNNQSLNNPNMMNNSIPGQMPMQMPTGQMPNGQMPNGQIPNNQIPNNMGNPQLQNGVPMNNSVPMQNNQMQMINGMNNNGMQNNMQNTGLMMQNQHGGMQGQNGMPNQNMPNGQNMPSQMQNQNMPNQMQNQNNVLPNQMQNSMQGSSMSYQSHIAANAGGGGLGGQMMNHPNHPSY